MEINLNDYEEVNFSFYDAYAKSEELLGLDTSFMPKLVIKSGKK